MSRSGDQGALVLLFPFPENSAAMTMLTTFGSSQDLPLPLFPGPSAPRASSFPAHTSSPFSYCPLSLQLKGPFYKAELMITRVASVPPNFVLLQNAALLFVRLPPAFWGRFPFATPVLT